MLKRFQPLENIVWLWLSFPVVSVIACIVLLIYTTYDIEKEKKWPPFCKRCYKMNSLRVKYCIVIQLLNWNWFSRVKLTTTQLWFQIVAWRRQSTSILTHWGRDKMDAISQTTFSNAFSWMKIFEFRLKFHWSLFPKVLLTIFQQWFR